MSPVFSQLNSQPELPSSTSSPSSVPVDHQPRCLKPQASELRPLGRSESIHPSGNLPQLSSSVKSSFPIRCCCCDDLYHQNLHLRIADCWPYDIFFTYLSSQIGPYFTGGSLEALEPEDSGRDPDSRAAAFHSTIQRDTVCYQGQRALEDAQAAYCTIWAQQMYIQKQIREQELKLKRLHDEAEAVNSRLNAAMYQVGKVREALRLRGIPIDDNYDPELDDPLDDTLYIVRDAFHKEDQYS